MCIFNKRFFEGYFEEFHQTNWKVFEAFWYDVLEEDGRISARVAAHEVHMLQLIMMTDNFSCNLCDLFTIKVVSSQFLVF
jgi:hypothetical protein